MLLGLPRPSPLLVLLLPLLAPPLLLLVLVQLLALYLLPLSLLLLGHRGSEDPTETHICTPRPGQGDAMLRYLLLKMVFAGAAVRLTLHDVSCGSASSACSGPACSSFACGADYISAGVQACILASAAC